VSSRRIELAAGEQTLPYNARKLRPGSYRATVKATNTAGSSAPATVTFTRPRR
jgi:hypothetical protein